MTKGVTMKLNERQLAMLRSLANGRSRRVGGHRKLGETMTRNALARRGLIEDNDYGDFWISDEGRRVLAELIP